MRSAIVHLVGYPASGKYTIAKSVAAAADARGQRFVVVDNHLTGNVILSVVEADRDHGLPDGVWDRVGEVREIMHRAIEDLSPSSWSFIFTNVLCAGDAADEAVPRRLAQLAQARDAIYLPVLVRCEVDELLTRVSSPERGVRHKWTDPDAVRSFVGAIDLVELGVHDPLVVDSSRLRPDESAERILDEHTRRSAHGGPIR